MRVLVTGGAGYIGTPLCIRLARHHEVVCWDPGFFGHPFEDGDGVQVVPRRIQELTAGDLDRLAPDWIIHLSGLSNDPMADFAPELNWSENMGATQLVGELSNRKSIPLVFASSASVYGFNEDGPLDETAPVRPLGHYSRSKAAAEQWLLEHHGRPIILRQATVMGPSGRMRLDLLTNGMTRSAWCHGRLQVLYGGREVRAQVHVDDLVRAYERILESDLPAGVYNVCSRNDSVMELARTIRAQVADRRTGGVELEITDEPRVHRSYALRADKLQRRIGWEPTIDVSTTVEQVRSWLATSDANPEDPRYYNIRWMRLLHEAQQILGRSGPLRIGDEASAPQNAPRDPPEGRPPE
jgi:nucleoside-diphosphate-sugar epimerase